MQDVKLTGHHYPRPLTVCVVKEIKRCPHCNANREQGFEILIDETHTVIVEEQQNTQLSEQDRKELIDKNLTFGIACLCWCCGFRF